MLNLSLAGNLGRDAQYKTTQGGNEFCSFPVAVTVGFGDKKSTVWIDVTKWGKGAQGLASILRKGSKVAVSGELSTREHEGKTYLQCRANDVTIQGTPQGSGQTQPEREPEPQGASWDDDGDSIPF